MSGSANNLGLAIVLALVSISPAIAGNVATLPNGNYRFCSEPPKQPAPGYIVEGGMCFRFRKIGSEVVGLYYAPATSNSLCIKGRVHSNLILGTATETLYAEMAEGLPPGDVPYVLDSDKQYTDANGFLTLSESKRYVRGRYYTPTNTYDAKVYYKHALLSLVRFKMYNAGAVSPPLNCD